MKKIVKKDIRVVCVQHSNGDCWITTKDDIPSHWKVLSEKIITVEFEIDLGYDPNRAYPEGRATEQSVQADWALCPICDFEQKLDQVCEEHGVYKITPRKNRN